MTDDTQPATKGDVRQAQEELAMIVAKSFANVVTKEDAKQFATKDDLKKLAKKVDGLQSSQLAILSVVQSIDQQLREHKTHPDRIARLERSVFR
ncbi:MAG TPA: hypothetical protein VJC05_02970 [Candidatus Andersenbacteria bacterium]|nr:MAG: hypothetical protein A2854_01870 [Parcubacteria group bacterium RIFCSPHIGHO2_01_FULL_56_18]HLD25976.1 hypothetical protein [Candidatus Andersenbacteria bacterium]